MPHCNYEYDEEAAYMADYNDEDTTGPFYLVIGLTRLPNGGVGQVLAPPEQPEGHDSKCSCDRCKKWEKELLTWGPGSKTARTFENYAASEPHLQERLEKYKRSLSVIKERTERSTTRIAELRAEISRHNTLYYDRAFPEISDREFDALTRELQKLENK